MASARIQRWALILSAYSHTIAYKPGGDHINADVLSRLPLPEASSDVPLPREIVLPLDTLHGPLTAIQIKQWTDRDPLLSSLRNMALHGRYSANKEQLHPFTGQKDELSIQDGCILWRTWVVIPQQDMRQWWGNYMKDILVYAEWRALHVALHGGQELMPTWREWWKTAISVKSTASHLLLHPFTLQNDLPGLGPASTSILLYLF